MRVDAKIERRGRWTRSVTVYEHRDAGEAYKSDWPAMQFPVSSEVGYANVFGERWARAKARRMIRKQELKVERRHSAVTIGHENFEAQRLIRGNTGHVVIHQPRKPSDRPRPQPPRAEPMSPNPYLDRHQAFPWG